MDRAPVSIPRPPVSQKFTRRTEVIASAEALLRDFECGYVRSFP